MGKIGKWFSKHITHPVYCTYMCIKYPFLYPRNRFSGRHYTNWKLSDYISSIYKKYHIFDTDNGKRKEYNGHEWYLKKMSENSKWYTWWTNWWAPAYIFILNRYYDLLSFFHFIPTYIEWDVFKNDCPGWYKRFGKELLKRLRKQLIKDKMLYKWRIMDIKEKYGTFRLYCNYGSRELYGIIDEYENKSEFICIDCGKDADVITSLYYWKCPYCNECYNDTKGTVASRKINGEWIHDLDEKL